MWQYWFYNTRAWIVVAEYRFRFVTLSYLKWFYYDIIKIGKVNKFRRDDERYIIYNSKNYFILIMTFRQLSLSHQLFDNQLVNLDFGFRLDYSFLYVKRIGTSQLCFFQLTVRKRLASDIEVWYSRKRGTETDRRVRRCRSQIKVNFWTLTKDRIGRLGFQSIVRRI